MRLAGPSVFLLWGLGLIPPAMAETKLLTDPFLQLPTQDGVHVVWFTTFEGQAHNVQVEGLEVPATSQRMSRLAEDARSFVGSQSGDGWLYAGVTPREVWRHEAHVTGLSARVPYHVSSTDSSGATVTSERFTLAPLPGAGDPLRILLTSDHQLRPMALANLQKVSETVGRVDAIFFAGDLQNIPDRASEWFDDNRGYAFFPGLQGRGGVAWPPEGSARTTYRGGEIIQHAPLFPLIGNHETMGRFNPRNPLAVQYNDPRPRWVAEALYEQHADIFNPTGDPQVRADWIRDNSYNTITYEELFTLPATGPQGEKYYGLRFGDVYLLALNASRIWRPFSNDPDLRGKYREAQAHLATPDQWGWGEFIFEDLSAGSPQHDWLQDILSSPEFQSAPVKLVMLHQPVHGVGGNSNPVFAKPAQVRDYDAGGRLSAIRYEYPIDQDQFLLDVEPLLVEAGVDLVLSGHSHVWYRTESPAGLTFLESSNVGNSHGCFPDGGDRQRPNGPDDSRFDPANYVLAGDPHGYPPAVPTEFSPVMAEDGSPMPCVASNTVTVFSILETGPAGAFVNSYVYDTEQPGSAARLFDRFAVN